MAFREVRSREDFLKDDPLRDFFVWWDDLSSSHAEQFQTCLAEALTEQDLQDFLEYTPIMLVQHLGGGGGRWVIPKQRLGSEHVTDFVIGERNSDGYKWQAVELESPRARMFTKRGDPTKELSHAIRQIQDWRICWLENE